jgi:DNA-directed RNA polymerase subunit RPC12/RpoP
MERRVFHGLINPGDVSKALLAEFNRGNLRAQALGEPGKMIVQIATRPGAPSGGETALTITLQTCEDGIMADIGQQTWLGVAASLGTTAFWALRNPFSLLGRLDDIAQDLENLQLTERVWQVIARSVQTAGASMALSDRLRRVVCDYCGTGNPVGEGSCMACGAPLGRAQPGTCPSCGFVIMLGEVRCPNCGRAL